MALFTDAFLIDLLGIVTAVIAVVYGYFKWTYQYWKRRNIPYLEPSIPLGNLENPLRTTVPAGELFARFYNIAKSNGWRYCGLYTIVTPALIVTDLDLIKHVLTKDFNHFTHRGMYTNEKDDPLRNHLAALDGTKWKNMRAKLSPTFTSGKLKGMFQTLADCGLVLEKYIAENVKSDEAIDIKDILGKFSTDIIGSCAFGIDCNSFKDPNSPFRFYGKKAISRSASGNLKDQLCQSFPNLARALHITNTPKDITDFFMKVVEDTITYREKNNIIRNDFLQLLIDIKNNKTGDSMTMPEVAAQSFVFFVGGFETSSTTMTFTLYNLATHPEIQDKVREEINTVLKKYDDKITYDSMAELKYLKQVIDETMRIYPPAPLTARTCVEDYKIPGEDVIIEKGTKVIIPILGIQKDPEYFKNPDVFDPSRFSEENKNARHHYTHIPFGEGPRICIGERFGIMQTKVGLTSVLRKFRISLHEKTELPLKLSVKSVLASVDKGIWFKIEKL